MSLHHTGVFVSCEQEGCKVNETVDNPAGMSDAMLEGKTLTPRLPYRVGWYLPVYGGGKRLCPNHHQAFADRLGWDSLYDWPKPRGLPIKKDEASKSAKKRAKEGAD